MAWVLVGDRRPPYALGPAAAWPARMRVGAPVAPTPGPASTAPPSSTPTTSHAAGADALFGLAALGLVGAIPGAVVGWLGGALWVGVAAGAAGTLTLGGGAMLLANAFGKSLT